MDDRVLDMDGNELKVGDYVLFPVRAIQIRRAKIISIDRNWVEVEMIKSKRRSKLNSVSVLKYEIEGNREYIK